MATLEEIKATPSMGNAYSDRGLLDMIHNYILDPSNSIEDRALALREIDRVMGSDYIDERPHIDQVNDYIENNS